MSRIAATAGAGTGRGGPEGCAASTIWTELDEEGTETNGEGAEIAADTV